MALMASLRREGNSRAGQCGHICVCGDPLTIAGSLTNQGHHTDIRVHAWVDASVLDRQLALTRTL